MKTSVLISLSALTLSLVAAPVLAQERAAINQASTRSNVAITPFALVTGSYGVRVAIVPILTLRLKPLPCKRFMTPFFDTISCII